MKTNELAILKRAVANEAPVYFEWLDSWGACGWKSLDSLEERCPLIRSVGLAVRLNEQALTITTSRGGEVAMDPLSVPLFAITKVTELEPKGRR